ncbi:group III truncated hemoglobin [Chitinophagales bacterium]|nr:group III truncated hemoglobin [Chitinophagales bacterium]
MRDIKNRADIELLVNKFYEKAINDELIGVFFTEVMKLNFDHHIPLIVDFWETTLLKEQKYKGNPMIKHIELSRKKKMTKEHFDKWLALWESTVNQNFAGVLANEAIKRSKMIADLMLYKIDMAHE